MDGLLRAHRLGRVEYEDGLSLQAAFAEARLADAVPDSVFLLEHPAVLTLGRAGKSQNIVAPQDLLASEGIQVFHTDRGGDVTYHGPGQIVGYPVVKLPPSRQDVKRYVTDLEEALIRTLARWGIEGTRVPGWTGVWVRGNFPGGVAKVAAIGVHLARWVTRHGFALNVATNLAHFGLIVPCGIQEAGVTSMERLLGRPVERSEVEAALAEELAQRWEARLAWGAIGLRTICVAVTRGGPADTRVLLLRRTPERGGFWQIVTGRIEPAESPADAAGRELCEETGARLPVRGLDYRHAFSLQGAVPTLTEETAFGARWPEGLEVALSKEHREFAWATVEQALSLLPHPGLREAVRRAAQM